jgi:hypothetical protein
VILGKQLIPFFELPAKLSPAKVPAVYFSIREIEFAESVHERNPGRLCGLELLPEP